MPSQLLTHKRILMAGLFLLALLVRLPILLTQHDSYLTGGISTTMGLVARSILEGQGLVEPLENPQVQQFFEKQASEGKLIDLEEAPDFSDVPTKPFVQRMPGYSFLLALIWKLTGSYRYLPMQILQVLLSALLPLMICSAGSRLFGNGAGVVAGVLTAINLPEARLAVVPLYDWWILFLAGFLIWFLARSAERRFPLLDFTVVGLVAAVGLYLKSTFILVPVFLTLGLVPKISWRRALLSGSLALGIPLLALAPWAIRNYRTFDRFLPTNTFFWATLWEGFGETPNDFGAILNDRATYLQVMAADPTLVYASPEYDDHFRPKVLSVFSSHPEFVASLWGRRLVRGILFPDNHWGFPAAENPARSLKSYRKTTGRGVVGYALRQPWVAAVKVAKRIWAPLIFFLAMLTVFVDRDRWRELLPYLALAITFPTVSILIHLEGRYLLPAGLVWILMAGAPLAAWLSAWRGNPSEASQAFTVDS